MVMSLGVQIGCAIVNLLASRAIGINEAGLADYLVFIPAIGLISMIPISVGGTGLRVFHPLVIALAAGANFIARAFSGDPNGTAQIIAQAIRHRGFSFVEILSPCVTFRPEQREWKQQAHPAPVAPTNDPARAARRLMTDDGFNIGVLYAGERTADAATTGKAQCVECVPYAISICAATRLITSRAAAPEIDRASESVA